MARKINQCLECKNQINSYDLKRKFCSHKCYTNHRKKLNEINRVGIHVCEFCKKEFKHKNKNAKFCSKECHYNSMRGKSKYSEDFTRVANNCCQFCNKEFYSTQKNRKFCSRECYSKFRINYNLENSIRLNCDYCSKEFIKKHKSAKFCSKECSDKSKIKFKDCSFCGKTFKPSDGRVSTCSPNCRNKLVSLKRGSIVKKCLYCNKDISVIKSRQESHKFCSYPCYLAYRKLNIYDYVKEKDMKNIRICVNCECEFYRIESLVYRDNNKRVYCSRKCMGEYFERKKLFSGKNNGMYVNGNSYLNRGDSWASQAIKVRKRDSNCCRLCKTTKSKCFEVHHIVPYSMYSNEKLANRLINLVTLCYDCHKKIHSHFYKNTPKYFKYLYEYNQKQIPNFELVFNTELVDWLLENGLKLTPTTLEEYDLYNKFKIKI